MKLPDGTYWLSLHGPDNAEASYDGYARVPCEFMGGAIARVARFGRCMDGGQHLVVNVAVCHSQGGRPSQFVSLTKPIEVSANVSPVISFMMIQGVSP